MLSLFFCSDVNDVFISVTAWRVCCGLKGYFIPPPSIKPGIQWHWCGINALQYTEDENIDDELKKVGGYVENQSVTSLPLEGARRKGKRREIHYSCIQGFSIKHAFNDGWIHFWVWEYPFKKKRGGDTGSNLLCRTCLHEQNTDDKLNVTLSGTILFFVLFFLPFLFDLMSVNKQTHSAF